ncbi:DUF5677 domain-containing protein [Methylobacterium sp. D53M]
MGNLQRALNDVISQLPRNILKKFVKEKLVSSNVAPSEGMIDALTDHILKGEAENFVWHDDSLGDEDIDIKLSFDGRDFEELDRLINDLPGKIEHVVQDSVEVGGKILHRQLTKNWQTYGEIQRIEISEFAGRLEDRWGKGLDQLRMLLTASREISQEAAKRHRRSKSNSHRQRHFILARLHMRACQISDEIIVLLENGFADGAMARWRTLHEIDVVATVIEDGDEVLAQRYIDHEIIDQKKMIDDWDENQVNLGYSPVDQKTRREVESKYQAALKNYGPEFKNEYGWASQHLSMKRPDFRAMQRASEQSGMSTYYKLANYNVHASSRSMFVRLTDMGSDIPIAGRSNAGLLEPGQNTAFTLTRITAALLGRVRGLDELVKVRALTMMRDAAQEAFVRADRRLQRDEAALRRAQKKKANRSRARRSVSAKT